MLRFSLLAALTCAASWASVDAAAQEPQSTRPDFQRLIRESHGINSVDGQLVALAGGVEASFETGRIVITPLLGREAPADRPLVLELTEVARGASRVHVERTTAPKHRSNQVDYAHGGGITERYVSRPDGIKQSVLIQDPIPGQGDLVVRMRVTTDLECALTEDARQLDFEAGALGGIHIGTVLGIDAAGQTAEGTMRFDGQHLDLVLPAGFVDQAAYPLDVDPVLGGLINTGRSFSDNEMDIAFDVTNDVYGIVYQSESSATNHNIYLQLITGAGARQGGAVTIVRNNHLSTMAKIANCNASDQFVIVWQDNGTGVFNVQGCAVDVLTSVRSAIVDIATNATDDIEPDVGGDSTLTGATPQCVAVWNEGSDIKSSVVDLSTDPPTIQPAQTVIGGIPVNSPVITKDGGADRRYFVALQVSPQGVLVTPIDATGTVVGGPVNAAFSPTSTFSRPDIDGDGRHFTVVMEELEPGSTNDHDIRASHGVWTGTGLQLVDTFLIESDPGVDESRPCIALMHSKYVAAWIDPNGTAADIEATNLGLDSAARCGNPIVVASTATNTLSNPAIVSRRSGGDTLSDSGLLSNREENLTNARFLIRSRIYTTFGGGPVSVIPGTGGCANGATAGVSGAAALGNQHFKVTLSGADPSSAIAVLALDLSLLPPVSLCGPGCGGIIVPQATAQLPLSQGATELGLPIPCSTAFSGASMYAQWLVLGSSPAGSCPIIPGLRPSDAIQITFGD
ncbi:MAG: hypothetical protein O2865_01770 [Planctomycetota bacterium]|nr:hypothetical protein [Planctomycetota bacterium]MDA0934343.1 hypothetical protein [Planctomycetota bacterium]MDA1220535.1 hypothetical protein [Planctomycetota bacterium]